jgi:hypothetical protein
MITQSDKEVDGPYWRTNGAIMIVQKSLSEVVRVLASMLREQRIVDKKLGPYFDKYPDDPDSYTDEAADDEFGEICDRLWWIESDLSCQTRTAILMATIDLESTINRFCYYNVGETTAESIERLSLTEKLEVIHAVLHLNSFKGTHQYQAVRKLVNWRNAYAHGKCTDMPHNTIKENHLKQPDKFPGSADEVQELLEHLDAYLLISRYLCKISNNKYTSMYPIEYDEIEDILRDIRTFHFEKGFIAGRRQRRKSNKV